MRERRFRYLAGEFRMIATPIAERAPEAVRRQIVATHPAQGLEQASVG